MTDCTTGDFYRFAIERLDDYGRAERDASRAAAARTKVAEYRALTDDPCFDTVAERRNRLTRLMADLDEIAAGSTDSPEARVYLRRIVRLIEDIGDAIGA